MSSSLDRIYGAVYVSDKNDTEQSWRVEAYENLSGAHSGTVND